MWPKGSHNLLVYTEQVSWELQEASHLADLDVHCPPLRFSSSLFPTLPSEFIAVTCSVSSTSRDP